jgi:tetratricopeptide (TPR) repeat protein
MFKTDGVVKKNVIAVLPVFFLCCFPLQFFSAACSTAPKNPGDIYDLRKQAENQLDLGNKQADRGNYENALILLEESRRLAVLTDDPSLRIRTGLSRGNVLFALDRREEAAASWQRSLDEAQSAGNSELAAVSRIHIARGKLLAKGGASDETAQSVRDEAVRELGAIKSDRLYTAFAWTVIGLAEKALGRYAEAETAIKHSLEIHEKDRYLEQAAYDWYLTGNFRSLAKNYTGARQAIESAIALDRRVENSFGLATDWRALGDIYKNEGKQAEADAAYLRSAEIFRGLGSDAELAATESKLEKQ